MRKYKSAKPSALLDRAYNLKSDTEAKNLYRDWAETYDSTMQKGLGYLTPHKTAELLFQFTANRSDQVLDVGAGTGLTGVALSKLGFSTLDAMDYSKEMLAIAAEKRIYRTLHCADLNETLDIPSSKYQALICTGTFTHAHVGANCLNELFRILSRGGIFACTVHKDVWQTSGFNTLVTKMTSDRKIETLYHEPGSYFTTSDTTEGYYIVWRRL